MRLDDGRVVPNFIQQSLRGEPLTIYGDGEQTRSFCYVDDLIDGIFRLMVSDFHEHVNIGNPSETSILEFANLVNELIGNKAGTIIKMAKRLVNDPQRRQPDITRAKTILQWEPEVSLEDGLSKTIPYFKAKMNL
jgi:dTDP-glucose 4,6-dehydratase